VKSKDTEVDAWRHGFKVGALTLGLSLLLGFCSGYVVRAVPFFLAFFGAADYCRARHSV